MKTLQQAQEYVTHVGVNQAKRSVHYLLGKDCECNICFCCRVWEDVNTRLAQAINPAKGPFDPANLCWDEVRDKAYRQALGCLPGQGIHI